MDPPYSIKRPLPRPGQLARQWYNSNGAYEAAWRTTSVKENDLPHRVLYRVTQYVNNNLVLLKDFKDKSQAPRVLLFRKANSASLAHDENNRVTDLDDLKLQIFDEVLVSQYAPWSDARGTRATEPDEPIRVNPKTRMINTHAEATIIWLSKRAPTKRCVSFIEKRRQFEKERDNNGKVHLRADIIDPANMRSTLVTAQKMYADELVVKGTRHTGLPVYLDYCQLPKGVCVDAFRGIYCPAECASWFEGTDFKRHQHGLSILCKICAVELDRERPAQEVRRLADPFSVPVDDQLRAVEEHEQAIASSIVLA